jgi:2-dehydropantoate 2-reductase
VTVDVLVVGAGAIGGVLAGYLAGAGHGVVAVDEWPEHVAAIGEHGLVVDGARGPNRFRFVAAPWHEVESVSPRPELVVVAVKSYDTVRAAELVAPLLSAETSVVSTQNGINEDTLSELLGRERVVGAVTEIGGYVARPGEIVETRRDGGFVIGELDGSDGPRIRRIQAVLSACAPTIVSSSIRSLLWSKLTWNCMMNPLTALTGLGQGEVWTTPTLAGLAVAVGQEARDVAQADGAGIEPLTFLGVDLPGLLSDDPGEATVERRRVVRLYEPQATKSTSMREDVRHGRRTEIGFLNGHVVRRGDDLGVPVELNRALARLVAAVECCDLAPGPDLLAPLVPS